MDTEILNIFEEALEAEAPAEPAQDRDQAVLDYAIAAAVQGSGARDPELLEHLLRQADLQLEDGAVTGLSETLADLRSSRPYLFLDGGSRPRFAAATQGRSLQLEDEVVAQRYKNNPWYRR